jgi:hypothetical protein
MKIFKKNFSLWQIGSLGLFIGLFAAIVFLFFSFKNASDKAKLLQADLDQLVRKQASCQIDNNQGEEKIPELGNINKECASYLKFKRIKASFIPSGVPDIYGKELNISFDAVQDAINKVRVYGPTYGQAGKKIILTGHDLERYINIGSQTACKYCCGARTLVDKNGKAACGCAHSQMMRGLAAYLIKNHPELSDEQILEEVNKWRATFFPKQTLSDKLSEMEKAGEPGIKELLEEFPDFLPQMVGGC